MLSKFWIHREPQEKGKRDFIPFLQIERKTFYEERDGYFALFLESSEDGEVLQYTRCGKSIFAPQSYKYMIREINEVKEYGENPLLQEMLIKMKMQEYIKRRKEQKEERLNTKVEPDYERICTCVRKEEWIITHAYVIMVSSEASLPEMSQIFIALIQNNIIRIPPVNNGTNPLLERILGSIRKTLS